MKTTFETGAKTHAVNDLILFTDNTKELAELRDNIYRDWQENGNFGTGRSDLRFIPLIQSAKIKYCTEFPKAEDHKHIYGMSIDEEIDFCKLYVKDFENWKQENN